MPMPVAIRSKVRGQNIRLPASYLNYYLANEVVLMPSYGSSRDAAAAAILGKAFPDRRIVLIDCRDLVYGAGTLHCITQQQPAI
jgi:agmatine deiminase